MLGQSRLRPAVVDAALAPATNGKAYGVIEEEEIAR